MASEPISKLLGDNTELKPLTERLDEIKRLQRRYRTIAPEQLAAASRVCAIDGTIVVVSAASGAVAAALRQIAPRLLEGLRGARKKTPKHSEDQDFTSIRIEVQVTASQRRKPPIPRPPIPREGLARLAENLADSPLKEQLERMSGQSRKTRSRT
jgi:hypothetical protein